MQNIETTMQILAVDTSEDRATQIVYNYRNQHVYPYLESRGFGLVRCQGQSARRENIASETCRDDIAYITGSGHGETTAYIRRDDKGNPIIQVGDYQPKEADGKVVHLLACQTADKLGPDFVTNGCRAYFGYKGNFTFHPDFADIFLECDSEIDRAFADGLTAEEVHDRIIALYDQRIAELNQEIAGLGNEEDIEYIVFILGMISTLEINRSYLCTPSVDSRYGDPQARILYRSA